LKTLTVADFIAYKERGEKLTVLTVYDATFAALMVELGVEILLVGDSLGMVIQGHSTTVPVRVEDMGYHTRCVATGAAGKGFIMSDLPFQSYDNPQTALENATRLMQAGAMMIKVEGAQWLLPIVRYLTERGIPICGHIGLTPQSVHHLGGFKVQGRNIKDTQQLREDAVALVEAGVQLLVLECVPHSLATEITASVSIPTIGIGAGPGCDGQVLVLQDMLGLTPGKSFRFVRDFMLPGMSIKEAIAAYIRAVKATEFPADEHCFA
jgi:3-methyl-2-oxobutanoate hydroxymethyltransferase